MGECGCPACRQATLDHLESGIASPAEREKFQRRDRQRRVPRLRDLEEEVVQAEMDQQNLERIRYGWSLVDKSSMSSKTRLLAWLGPVDATGIDPESVREGLLAEGFITAHGDLTDAGRALLLG